MSSTGRRTRIPPRLPPSGAPLLLRRRQLAPLLPEVGAAAEEGQERWCHRV